MHNAYVHKYICIYTIVYINSITVYIYFTEEKSHLPFSMFFGVHRNFWGARIGISARLMESAGRTTPQFVSRANFGEQAVTELYNGNKIRHTNRTPIDLSAEQPERRNMKHITCLAKGRSLTHKK